MENSQKAQDNKKQFPGAGKFTRSDSTFKAVTYFTNGKTLVGYSKSARYKEPEDKIYMLEGWMIRLYLNGYWDRVPKSGRSQVKEIEWFETTVTGEEIIVMITTADQYHMGTGGHYSTNDRLLKFLQRFYECHRKGKVSMELRDKANGQTEEHYFDLSQKRFKNGEELLKHTLFLATKGWPHGRIQNFYQNYTEKYLSA